MYLPSAGWVQDLMSAVSGQSPPAASPQTLDGRDTGGARTRARSQAWMWGALLAESSRCQAWQIHQNGGGMAGRPLRGKHESAAPILRRQPHILGPAWLTLPGPLGQPSADSLVAAAR